MPVEKLKLLWVVRRFPQTLRIIPDELIWLFPTVFEMSTSLISLTCGPEPEYVDDPNSQPTFGDSREGVKHLESPFIRQVDEVRVFG